MQDRVRQWFVAVPSAMNRVEHIGNTGQCYRAVNLDEFP